jgi:GT2 family glycosyltransferase
MTKQDNPLIDIIIPLYKSAELAQRCIESVLKHLGEISGYSPRVILINDSPGDKPIEKMLVTLKGLRAIDKVFSNGENLGFVKTVNRGLKMSLAEGRDAILVNADTETFQGTLLNLVEVALSDAQIGFVSPRSNNASLCSLPHSFSGSVLTPQETYQQWKIISRTLPKFHFSPTAVGFYLYIKNSILGNFGGLNEQFGIGYEEENDLILRANKTGYRAAIANHSFAFHAGSASFNLRELDLTAHRNSNLQIMAAKHPEFLPLVRRYERSAHYRAELLMGNLIPDSAGNLDVAVDLLQIGLHHNGTNEFSLNVIKAFATSTARRYNLWVICTAEAFKFHKLDQIKNLRRADPENPGKFAIAVRLGQPFDMHHINVLETVAPINVFAMLDNIAEDCGSLSLAHPITELWPHVAQHANGLLFISKFGEISFYARHKKLCDDSYYTQLLSTKLSDYSGTPLRLGRKHVLVLGNHFAHKGSDSTAEILSKSYPTVQFCVLGSETFEKGNLRGFRSGTLPQDVVSGLFENASLVVLPSHVEGFGFGLMHALAARKCVLARDIPATREILASFKSVKGVHLYRNDSDLKDVFLKANQEQQSTVDDSTAESWIEWSNGLEKFFDKLVNRDDIFTKLQGRIAAADQLRKLANLEQQVVGFQSTSLIAQQPTQTLQSESVGVKPISANEPIAFEYNVDKLLGYSNEQFVEHAYLAILKRTADPSGIGHFLNKLNGGVAKIQILSDIAHSIEGKEVNAKISGLTEAIKAHKIKSTPVAKRFIDGLKAQF